MGRYKRERAILQYRHPVRGQYKICKGCGLMFPTSLLGITGQCTDCEHDIDLLDEIMDDWRKGECDDAD
jgi:hypothetical protein